MSSLNLQETRTVPVIVYLPEGDAKNFVKSRAQADVYQANDLTRIAYRHLTKAMKIKNEIDEIKTRGEKEHKIRQIFKTVGLVAASTVLTALSVMLLVCPVFSFLSAFCWTSPCIKATIKSFKDIKIEKVINRKTEKLNAELLKIENLKLSEKIKSIEDFTPTLEKHDLKLSDVYVSGGNYVYGGYFRLNGESVLANLNFFQEKQKEFLDSVKNDLQVTNS